MMWENEALGGQAQSFLDLVLLVDSVLDIYHHFWNITCSLLTLFWHNIVLYKYIFFRLGRVINHLQNLYNNLLKMSIFSSILTLLASRKVSVATKQRLQCVNRYQKRVQETKVTLELTGFTTVMHSSRSNKNFHSGSILAHESWGGLQRFPSLEM